MTIAQEAISEGGKYIGESNSLGHSLVKEVLRIIPDHQNSGRDIVEYQSKVMGSSAPWVRNRCSRKTFAVSIASTAAKMAS